MVVVFAGYLFPPAHSEHREAGTEIYKETGIHTTAPAGLCLVFLNAVGDVDIISDTDSMLRSIGPSSLNAATDAVQYSQAEILTAARVVSAWHSTPVCNYITSH